jgi:hypothetical protein
MVSASQEACCEFRNKSSDCKHSDVQRAFKSSSSGKYPPNAMVGRVESQGTLQLKVELMVSADRSPRELRGLTCIGPRCQKAAGARQKSQFRSCCYLQKPAQAPHASDTHTRTAARIFFVSATCSTQTGLGKDCVDSDRVKASLLIRTYSRETWIYFYKHGSPWFRGATCSFIRRQTSGTA